MKYDLKRATLLFNGYRDALFHCFPVAKKLCSEQAATVVDCTTADVDTIWNVMWDKPIYTFRGTDEGKSMVDLARPLMEGAWRECGFPGDYWIELVDEDRRTSSSLYDPGNYENPGAAIKQLAKLPGGNITYYVSWKIVNAGSFLRRQYPGRKAPLAFLAKLSRKEAVTFLNKECGKGWGPVTCLHFLTDLGMAFKPDQHVARTVAALGLVTCKKQDPDDNEALEINDALDELLPLVYLNATPRDRRHFDKTLMEISRFRLLPESMYTEKAKTLWGAGPNDISLWELRGGLKL